MKQKTFQASRAGYIITAEVTVIGKDLSIALVGGDTPHIGTVTWVSNNGASDTIRFPSHHGRFHKDDVLSEILIKQLQPLLPGNCVITAGIHVNGITKEQIDASFIMAEEIGKELANWIINYDFGDNEPVYEHYHQASDK
ncbi:amino acid decarboxylase [Enterococcus sp.]|uniref:prenylated flavin chaperone LpdD n=1 Tax=Enterococcus sp. TaxID=35783 RepID=UPI003C73F913